MTGEAPPQRSLRDALLILLGTALLGVQVAVKLFLSMDLTQG